MRENMMWKFRVQLAALFALGCGCGFVLDDIGDLHVAVLILFAIVIGGASGFVVSLLERDRKKRIMIVKAGPELFGRVASGEISAFSVGGIARREDFN